MSIKIYETVLNKANVVSKMQEVLHYNYVGKRLVKINVDKR